MKWRGQTGRGVMDNRMGKIGWSDVIAHNNTALDELFIQLPYNVHGGERVRAMGAHGEGPGACIGGLGVARCGRSGAGLRGGGMGLAGRPWGAGSVPLGGRHMDGARGMPREGCAGVTDEVCGWVNERTGRRDGRTGGGGWANGRARGALASQNCVVSMLYHLHNITQFKLST